MNSRMSRSGRRKGLGLLAGALLAIPLTAATAVPAQASTVTTGTVCLTTASTPGIYLEYWTGWSHEPVDAHYMYRGWCVKATGFGVHQGQYVVSQYGTVYNGGCCSPFLGDGWQPYSVHYTGKVSYTGHKS